MHCQTRKFGTVLGESRLCLCTSNNISRVTRID